MAGNLVRIRKLRELGFTFLEAKEIIMGPRHELTEEEKVLNKAVQKAMVGVVQLIQLRHPGTTLKDAAEQAGKIIEQI